MIGPPSLSRRTVLAAIATAGAAGIVVAKGPGTIDWGDGDDETPTPTPEPSPEPTPEPEEPTPEPEEPTGPTRTLVVDPAGGDDAASGTETAPLATLRTALGLAQPGDTVLLRAGTERVDDSMAVDVDDLTVTVAPGATFRLNASAYKPGDDPRDDPFGSGGALTVTDATGVTIDGTPGRIRIENSGWFGLLVRRSTDFTVRGVTVLDSSQSGVHVAAGCADGLFEDCASIGNFGPRAGQNWGSVTGGAADGFSAAAGSDASRSEWPRRITFRNCLAHHNSDDGWDLLRADDCVIERCISYWNGYSLRGRLTSAAPGNGFKLGYGRSYYAQSGNEPPRGHRVSESIAYGNGAWGVTYGGGDGHVVDRVTAFDCNRKRGRHPIGFWDPEGGSVTRCLTTGIEVRDAVTTRDNELRDVDDWGVDVRTDARGHARAPARFGTPSPDSPLAGVDVGAAGRDGDWIAGVLAMRERPVVVVF